MRVVLDVALGLVSAMLEVLPSDEKEAGPWLAGFCLSFVLHWTILILVTMAYLGGQR